MFSLEQLEVIPYIDPYHRETGQLTKTELHIDPQERKIWVFQKMDSHSQEIAVYLQHQYAFKLPWHSSEDSIRAFLGDSSTQELLMRIHTGHAMDWDGRNLRGNLSEDALKALQEFDEKLLSLDQVQYWLNEETNEVEIYEI